MDDLLDILNNTEPPKAEVEEVKKVVAEPAKDYGDSKKKNLWEDEISPVEIDKDGLQRFNRTFTVVTHDEVPGEVIILIEQLAKLLNSKGFTYRYDGNKQDKGAGIAYEAAKSRSEIYLPWKGFNKDVTGKLNKPSEKAYGYAAGIHKGFNKIPAPVKAIVARNVHTVLGENCDTPINLLITYTSDGAEVNADVKYKTTGPIGFFINASEAVNTPVFNLKNSTAKERIVEFLNTMLKDS